MKPNLRKSADTNESGGRAALERDIKAFYGLNGGYDGVYGRALNLCNGDPETAADLIQTAILNLVKYADRYVSKGKFTALMHKVVFNTFVNRYRKRQKGGEICKEVAEVGFIVAGVRSQSLDQARERDRYSHEVLVDLREALDDLKQRILENASNRLTLEELDELLSGDVDAIIGGGEMWKDLLDQIYTLPLEFRIILFLSDLLKYSYKESALIVGCPVGTVMSRLYRARRLVRRRTRIATLAKDIYGIEEPAEEKKDGKNSMLTSQ